jgi:hypothetical protein
VRLLRCVRGGLGDLTLQTRLVQLYLYSALHRWEPVHVSLCIACSMKDLLPDWPGVYDRQARQMWSSSAFTRLTSIHFRPFAVALQERVGPDGMGMGTWLSVLHNLHDFAIECICFGGHTACRRTSPEIFIQVSTFILAPSETVGWLHLIPDPAHTRPPIEDNVDCTARPSFACPVVSCGESFESRDNLRSGYPSRIVLYETNL